MDVQLAHASAPAGEDAARTAAGGMNPAANDSGTNGDGSNNTGSSQLSGSHASAFIEAGTNSQQQQQAQPQTLRASASNADMTSSGGSSSSGDGPDTAATAAAGSSKKPTKQQRLFDALDGASLALTTASLGLSAALCALCLNNSNLAWAGVLLFGFIVAAPVVVGALILARNHWLVVALRYCLSVAALQRDSGLGFTNVRSRVLRLVLSGLSSCLLSMVGLVVALYLAACYVVTAVLSVPLLDIALLVSLVPWSRRRFISQDLVFLESYKPARALVSVLLQALPLAAISLLLLSAGLSGHTAGLSTAAANCSTNSSSRSNTNSSSSSNSNSSLLHRHTLPAAVFRYATDSNSIGSRGARRMLLLEQPPQQQQQQQIAPLLHDISLDLYNAAAVHRRRPQQQQQQHLTAHQQLLVRRKLAAAAPAPSPAGPPAPPPPPPGPDPPTLAGTRVQWTPETLSRALAAALNRSSAAAVAAAGGTPGSSSNGAAAAAPGRTDAVGLGAGGVLPTVQVIASEKQGGDVQLTVVVPPVPGGAPPASGSTTGSSSSSTGNTLFDTTGLPLLGLGGFGSTNGSRRAGSFRRSSSYNNNLVITVPGWGTICDAARQLPAPLLYAAAVVSLLDAVLVTVLLLLGCCVARVGLLRQLGLTLRLKGGLRIPDYVAKEVMSQMLKDGGRRLHLSNVWYWGSSSSNAGGKLPLVPRYLFPPDGGWLVPGQMCHLAAQAYSSLADNSSSSSSSVQVLDIEHAASQDLSVLLRGGLESLPQLHSISLNWCSMGPKCLPPQLLLASKCLRNLTLSRCELAGYGASLLREVLASPDCPLVSLCIVKCQMSSTSVRAIASGLAVNSSLKSVKFSGNLGGKPAALAFATALQANPGSLQHLNLSFNKLCPSGGDALANVVASAHTRAAANGSSSRGLQRLVVQRKEVGGAGLRSLVQGLRRCTGYSGKLSLRVLQQPNPVASQGEGSRPGDLEPCVIQLVELPVVFVIHEDQELLMSESWVEPLLARLQQQQEGSSESLQEAGNSSGHESGTAAAAPADHTVITVLENAVAPAGAAVDAAADLDVKCAAGGSSSRRDQRSKPAAADAKPAAAATGSEAAASSSSSPSRSPSPDSSSSNPRVTSVSSFASSSSNSSSSSKPAAVDSSCPGFSSRALSIEPCSSLLLPDGPTPMGSTADCISAQSVAAAAAAAAAAADSDGGSSSSSSKIRDCPMLIFLSQNDPCDSVAAALKNIEGLVAADLAGLPLGNKGIKAVASALQDASSLQQLLLQDTGVLEEGAVALAAGLIKRANSVARPAGPAAAAAGPAAGVVSAGVTTTEHGRSRRHRRQLGSSQQQQGSDRRGTSSSSQATGAAAAVAAAAAAVDRISQQHQHQQQQQPAGTPAATGAAAAVAAAAVSAVLPERSPSVLHVLDLSRNTICDAGATALAAAVSSGACPQLKQLSLVDNRYPFDWSTIMQLQRLEMIQSGLRVELGAPSTWCLNPGVLAGKTSGILPAGSSSSSSASSESSEDLCGVCFDAPNSLHIRSCSHRLCIDCYKQLVRAAAGGGASSSRQLQQLGRAGCPACPFCRTPMTGFMYSAWVEE